MRSNSKGQHLERYHWTGEGPGFLLAVIGHYCRADKAWGKSHLYQALESTLSPTDRADFTFLQGQEGTSGDFDYQVTPGNISKFSFIRSIWIFIDKPRFGDYLVNLNQIP